MKFINCTLLLFLISFSIPAYSQDPQSAAVQSEQIFIEAAGKGDMPQISAALKKGVDVNSANKIGTTALHKASENGHLNVVKILIDNGANVNVFDQYEMTPLHLAAKESHLDTVNVLIEKGANIRSADNRNSILAWAAWGDPEISKIFIAKGADVNKRDKTQNTPLMIATKIKHGMGSVPVLVEHGADVNLQNNDGNTALMNVSDPAMAEFLISKGANVNLANNNGLTALMAASRDGVVGLVNVLIAHGADVNAKDKEGNNALAYAEANGWADAVVDLLLSKGAKRETKEFVQVEFQDIQVARKVEHDGITTLILPNSFKASLQNSFPDYRMPNNRDYKYGWWNFKGVPFVAFGDFTGDKNQDIAMVLLRNGDPSQWRLIAFNKSGSSYTPHLIEESSPGKSNPVQRYFVSSIKYGKIPACISFFLFETDGGAYFCWEQGKYEKRFDSDAE